MPKVLVLKERGINCENESAEAFRRAGAKASIVHMNDLIVDSSALDSYQILMFPGGFSFGDDTGAGKAWAKKVRKYMRDEVIKFVNDGKLVLGVCNGFQALGQLGLLPAIDHQYGTPQSALIHNDSARYRCRWVDIKFEADSPWTEGMETISLPIAHGEGKFYAPKEVLEQINRQNLVLGTYHKGAVCQYQDLEPNPNGSLEDIAALTDPTGRVIGMMPHPERAIDFTQLPDWQNVKDDYKRKGKELPKKGPGQKLFDNAVKYCREEM